MTFDDDSHQMMSRDFHRGFAAATFQSKDSLLVKIDSPVSSEKYYNDDGNTASKVIRRGQQLHEEKGEKPDLNAAFTCCAGCNALMLDQLPEDHWYQQQENHQ